MSCAGSVEAAELFLFVSGLLDSVLLLEAFVSALLSSLRKKVDV